MSTPFSSCKLTVHVRGASPSRMYSSWFITFAVTWLPEREKNINLYDGIVGVRGSAVLSPDGKWILPFEADIGAGNSNWTWQAYAGLGYRFDWGDVVVSFRNLSFDQSSGKTLQGLRLTGPALSATFRW